MEFTLKAINQQPPSMHTIRVDVTQTMTVIAGRHLTTMIMNTRCMEMAVKVMAKRHHGSRFRWLLHPLAPRQPQALRLAPQLLQALRPVPQLLQARKLDPQQPQLRHLPPHLPLVPPSQPLPHGQLDPQVCHQPPLLLPRHHLQDHRQLRLRHPQSHLVTRQRSIDCLEIK